MSVHTFVAKTTATAVQISPRPMVLPFQNQRESRPPVLLVLKWVRKRLASDCGRPDVADVEGTDY